MSREPMDSEVYSAFGGRRRKHWEKQPKPCQQCEKLKQELETSRSLNSTNQGIANSALDEVEKLKQGAISDTNTLNQMIDKLKQERDELKGWCKSEIHNMAQSVDARHREVDGLEEQLADKNKRIEELDKAVDHWQYLATEYHDTREAIKASIANIISHCEGIESLRMKQDEHDEAKIYNWFKQQLEKLQGEST